MSAYEILEDTHETSVYLGPQLIAVFFGRDVGNNGVHRARRFVAQELADVCPTCGELWVEHEFAVPAPYYYPR